jgi:hypothetical protein
MKEAVAMIPVKTRGLPLSYGEAGDSGKLQTRKTQDSVANARDYRLNYSLVPLRTARTVRELPPYRHVSGYGTPRLLPRMRRVCVTDPSRSMYCE